MATTVTNTPLEVLYRTDTIIDGMTVIPPAPAFLRDRLFSNVVTSPTDQVACEFYRGKTRLAPFCSRYSRGIAVPREKTKMSLITPPFCKPCRVLTADDTYYRNMGAQIGANGNATNRDVELLTLDEKELDGEIARTEEHMVASVLFTGKYLALDGDTGKPVFELDYSPISITVLGKAWTDPTADPLVDLKGAMRLVSGASGFSANLIVMGKDSGDAFEANPNVKDAYNRLFLKQGEIDPKVSADIKQFGVVILGSYRGIPLYVDEGQYLDASGNLQYYVPPNEVLIAADAVQHTLAYAAVAQPNEDQSGMGPIEGTRIPYVYWSAEEEVRLFRLSSRPVPVPQDTASWTILKGAV